MIQSADDLVWEGCRELTRRLNVHHGMELSTSEVCTMMYRDNDLDSERAAARTLMMLNDPRAMAHWVAVIELKRQTMFWRVLFASIIVTVVFVVVCVLLWRR